MRGLGLDLILSSLQSMFPVALISAQDGYWGPLKLDKDQLLATEVSVQRVHSAKRFDAATLRCSIVHQDSGKCHITLHSGVKVTNLTDAEFGYLHFKMCPLPNTSSLWLSRQSLLARLRPWDPRAIL